MGKFLGVLFAISVIAFLLGLLGLASIYTHYEPIANLANEGWMQFINRYGFEFTVGGFIGIIFFGVSCAATNKGCKK